MIPVYDRNGRVSLWLDRDRFLSLSGESIGFFISDNIYDYNGYHIARFSRGGIRDHHGAVSGFISGAQSLGVIPPIPSIPPVPPIPSIEPIRPIPEIPPIPAIEALSWSSSGPFELFQL